MSYYFNIILLYYYYYYFVFILLLIYLLLFIIFIEHYEVLSACRRFGEEYDMNSVKYAKFFFPNFIAFTVGFTHFFSKNIWQKAFKEAGFSTFNEQKFTAFMSIFSSRP